MIAPAQMLFVPCVDQFRTPAGNDNKPTGALLIISKTIVGVDGAPAKHQKPR